MLPRRLLAWRRLATVSRAPARLHISAIPGFGTDGSQESRRVKGARADFEVERLKNDAALGGPELLERQYQVLKGLGLGVWGAHR